MSTQTLIVPGRWCTEMKWDYEGTFLKFWPSSKRSLIANQFCNAVRDGCQTVDDVLCFVRADANKRLGYGRYRDETQLMLLELTGSDEARRFAEHIIWREGLPFDERERLKSGMGNEFRRIYMSENPPSAKQLAYLKFLGCPSIPSTMLEAGELIARYKNGEAQRQKSATIR